MFSLFLKNAYLKNTILVVKHEGLNGEPIRTMAKDTVSNASKIDVVTGSLTNLANVNKIIGNIHITKNNTRI